MLHFLTLFLASTYAMASDTPSPGLGFGSYVQAGLALALIVAALAGTAWVARKLSGGKGFGHGGMKVIGGVALGPRERIVLVEIGDDWLVIGIVPGQIRTLHRMSKGSLLAPEEASGEADKPFAQWLKSVTERRRND
ncbi:flagellar biosynthetic protein FliO [Dechloromonas sp. XY25]|uniref:Flagellar protein n=1 Tax=Dechloromonas hankyongensis TaxID=2908002 RepID=A0ABS9K6Q1_9RHOO|nr:flagellar biosynthetic protein FliO [Dechloromonas hankyongensis]MCG2578851.1 flagellar biosynthetic protein FliO [Dechloromonas hankyongensis]